MPIYLRQSTASQEVPLGHFVDDTDGKTAETALTIANTDIKVWKTGATTLANKNSGGATHISGGIYYAVLDATDTDTIGPLVLFVAVSGALAVRVECVVLDEAVFDVWFGTTAPATATNITAGTITTVTNLTNLPTIPANWLTAAGTAADFTTEIQSGLATAAALATVQTSVDDLPTNAELATALAAADDAVLAQVALVKAKTDNLPADPADQSLIIAATDALATLIGDVPTNAELATALGTADDAVLAAIAALNNVSAAAVATAVWAAGTRTLTAFSFTPSVNVTQVNGVTLTGTGVLGDEWGPA